MNTAAIVPARAGSQRCPGKNIRDLGGRPLLAWALEALEGAGIFPYVSTNDPAVKAIDWGVPIIDRPDHLCEPNVCATAALAHAWECGALDGFEAAMLVQGTTPFVTADFYRAVAMRYELGDVDVVSGRYARQWHSNSSLVENDLGLMVPRSGPVWELDDSWRAKDRTEWNNQSPWLMNRRCAVMVGVQSPFVALSRWNWQWAGITIPDDQLHDINTEIDFEVAEALLVAREKLSAAG